MTDPISNERLLPCPFCGDPMEDRGYGAVHVAGEKCPIGGYAIDIAAWNHRQSPGVEVGEQMLIDAFLRGESWRKRNDVDRFVTVPEMVNKAARDYADATLAPLVHHEPASGDTQDDLPLTDEVQGVEPDYWAVWSVTGTHIGTWPDEADARAALAEYENRIPRMTGTIRPLYASPPKAVTITDEMVERAADELVAHGEFSWNPSDNRRRAAIAARIALTAALSSEAHNG